MKQANHYVALQLCLVLITLIISCKKLLEVPENAGGQITTSQVFTDSTNSVMGILGFYGNGTLGKQYLEQYAGLGADELLLNDNNDHVNIAYYKNELIAGNAIDVSSSTWFYWTYYYGPDAIYTANAALEALSKNTLLSSNLRNQLMGECRFMRAFYHFYLVNLFGNIPLVTTSSLQINQKLAQSPVSVVYDQIEEDLLAAKALLVPAYPSPGRQRPNRYTATALLARVYLYRKQWAKAAVECDLILGSGQYSLEANLDSVFLDGSKEAIWQVGSNTQYYQEVIQNAGPVLLPAFSFIPPTYLVSPFLLQAFEPDDHRRNQWVEGTTFPYPYKYKNSLYASSYTTTEDLMIFRLAEVYLIRAECKARQGDLIGAMQDINFIRSRAGLTNPKTAGSLSEAMGLILHERQVELFSEWGHRWLDLKRTDSINNILGREKPWWPADGHAALYPIPKSEIINNPVLIQNPGY